MPKPTLRLVPSPANDANVFRASAKTLGRSAADATGPSGVRVFARIDLPFGRRFAVELYALDGTPRAVAEEMVDDLRDRGGVKLELALPLLAVSDLFWWAPRVMAALEEPRVAGLIRVITVDDDVVVGFERGEEGATRANDVVLCG